MDNCPLSSDTSGCLTDLTALHRTSLLLLLQVEMLLFFSGENIWEETQCLRKGLALLTGLLEELLL